MERYEAFLNEQENDKARLQSFVSATSNGTEFGIDKILFAKAETYNLNKGKQLASMLSQLLSVLEDIDYECDLTYSFTSIKFGYYERTILRISTDFFCEIKKFIEISEVEKEKMLLKEKFKSLEKAEQKRLIILAVENLLRKKVSHVNWLREEV